MPAAAPTDPAAPTHPAAAGGFGSPLPPNGGEAFGSPTSPFAAPTPGGFGQAPVSSGFGGDWLIAGGLATLAFGLLGLGYLLATVATARR